MDAMRDQLDYEEGRRAEVVGFDKDRITMWQCICGTQNASSDAELWIGCKGCSRGVVTCV